MNSPSPPMPNAVVIPPPSENDRSSPGSVNGANQETYLGLARMSQESFFNRREIEWKTAIGLWTAIGAWTYFAVTNAEHLQGIPLGGGLLKAIAAFLAVLFFCWQLPLRRSFEDDKRWKHFYMHRAEGIDVPRPIKSSVLTGITDIAHLQWTLGQIAVTAFLLLVSYWATCSAISQSLSEPIVAKATSTSK